MQKLIFSENLRSMRKERGYSQQQLADYIGISQVAIAQYETGAKTPTIATADKLKSLFGVSMDVLCYGERNNV